MFKSSIFPNVPRDLVDTVKNVLQESLNGPLLYKVSYEKGTWNKDHEIHNKTIDLKKSPKWNPKVHERHGKEIFALPGYVFPLVNSHPEHKKMLSAGFRPLKFGDHVTRQTHVGSKIVNEDAKELEEISSQKLGAYIDKARVDSARKIESGIRQNKPSLTQKGQRRATNVLKALNLKLKKDIGLSEKLSADDPLEIWINDFINSDAPQFKGKSEEERKQMAIAAYNDAKRKEKEEAKEEEEENLFTKEELEKINKFFEENNDEKEEDDEEDDYEKESDMKDDEKEDDDENDSEDDDDDEKDDEKNLKEESSDSSEENTDHPLIQLYKIYHAIPGREPYFQHVNGEKTKVTKSLAKGLIIQYHSLNKPQEKMNFINGLKKSRESFMDVTKAKG